MAATVRRGGAPTFRRFVVLAATAGYVAAVYAVIVVAGRAVTNSPRPSVALAVLATALVALTLEPVRRALRRRIIRTDQDLLADFEATLAAAVPVDEVAPRMARLLAEATGARRVEVWLARTGTSSGHHVAARWPLEADPIDPAQPHVHVDDVLQKGQLLGSLLRDEGDAGALSPVESRLVQALIAQAGVALRTVALTADLREHIDQSTARAAQLQASRQRIVAAADSARHRLERDVHDGAQQHLVALAVNLSLAASVATLNAPRAAELIRDLQPAATAALATLEELSLGIYPRLLAISGLAVALEKAVATSPVPVSIQDETQSPMPPQIEAAAYFICLEAIQNAVKHAQASGISVRLAQADERLEIMIEDDGSGFDPETGRAGSGLGSMSDRIESLGGVLVVTSRAGGRGESGGASPGTTVSAWIPAATTVLRSKGADR
jgi:signal transduction histidine kinase